MSTEIPLSYSDVGLSEAESTDFIPHVRYGYDKKKGGKKREPILRRIDEPIPEGRNYAGPIDLLTPEEVEKQARFENPHAIRRVSCIGQELQNRCEVADRVLYPLLIESDDFCTACPSDIMEKMQEFVEEVVRAGPTQYRFFYSGIKSIHCYVPRVVIGEAARERLKEKATEFNDRLEEDPAVDFSFDLAIYSRKRQFRLPGTTHQKKGRKKVEIEPDWDRDRIIREAKQSGAEPPETFKDVLSIAFAGAQVNDPFAGLDVDLSNPLVQAARNLCGDWAVLSVARTADDTPEVPVPLIERGAEPLDPGERDLWNQYNGKEFSPYANASEGQSVCLLTVKGGGFCRKSVRWGSTLIPSFIHAAVGCDGEFTMDSRYAPVQLSPRDYTKRDWKEGETLVIIGGHSRNSKIIEVDGLATGVLISKLTDSDSPRREAVKWLRSEEYDVGVGPLARGEKCNRRDSRASDEESGSCSGSKSSGNVRRVNSNEVLPAENPTTPAGKLQQLAEQGDIERDLSHIERSNVANRLLSKYGWKPTWKWFQAQYGDRFDPEVTYANLKQLVESYSGLSHIQVPPSPQST